MGLGGFGVGLFVMGALEQRRGQRQAARAAQQEAEVNRRRADIQNVRSLRQQMRERAVLAGNITNTSAQSGTLGSSGFAGAQGSLATQYASNLGYSGQMAQLGERAFSAQLAGISGANTAANGALLSSIGSNVFNTFYSPVPTTSPSAVGSRTQVPVPRDTRPNETAFT